MSETTALPAQSKFAMSSEIGSLASDLIAAKKEFKKLLKTENNPFFKSKYADLAGAIDATDDGLSNHNLVVIQSPQTSGAEAGVVTLLAHTSGQWIKGELLLPVSKLDPQGAGSAITYSRRYSYLGVLGIAAEDDDGNAASANKPVTIDRSEPPAKQAPRATNARKPSPPTAASAASAPEGVVPNRTAPSAKNDGVAQSIERRVSTSEAEGSNPSAVANLHGIKATDSDLPDNLRLPTPSEFDKMYERLRVFDKAGYPLKKIGDYLKLRFKVPESKTAKDALTLSQWNDGMNDMNFAFEKKKLAELLDGK